jgi:hypothetical protein
VWLETTANARRKMGQLFKVYFRPRRAPEAAF